MSALTKARLAEITAGDTPTEVGGSSVPVQFNPTTLRVQIANKTAGGQQAGAQAKQRPGTGEMQVSFDLVFDTADDGEDVLKKTAMVERFVRPQGNQPGKEAPPRVLFAWGSFMVQGTMDSANIDLDLFDAGGTPLRAKVAVTIKGQDPRWTYTPAPPASPASPATGAGPGRSGLPTGAPGTQGSDRSPERVVQALPGESLQQLAARHGLDPSAWRALAQGLGNPLALGLGQEVALPPGLGQGSAAGRQAQGQDPARSTAGLGLVSAPGSGGSGVATPSSGVGSSSATRGTPDAVRQGQALAGRGGLGQAIGQVKNEVHRQGAGRSLSAFGVGPGGSADTQDRPWGAGVPLRPRIGSGLAAPEPSPAHLALGAPVVSTTVGASAAARARQAAGPSTGRGSRALTTRGSAVSAGCGCKGRRGRTAR